MPGLLCSGVPTDEAKNAKIKDSKAYCEGAVARTLSLTPVNPHEAGSSAADAWDAGVAVKAGGDDPPCCAPSGPAAV